MLKGKNKYETWENYSILSIFIGVVLLSSGMGLSILTPKGLPAILAMMGGLLSFVSTVALLAVWLIKEFKGE